MQDFVGENFVTSRDDSLEAIFRSLFSPAVDAAVCPFPISRPAQLAAASCAGREEKE